MTRPVIPPSKAILPEDHGQERLLLFILATMTFLAGLTLLVSLAGFRTSFAWKADLNRSATIHVISPDIYASSEQREMTLNALSAAIPEADFDVISKNKAQSLLEPWLGDIALPDDIPIPALIGVTSTVDLNLNIETIEATLRDQGINVSIDDHKRWNTPVQRSLRHIQTGLIITLLVILITSVAIAGFATLSTLHARSEIVTTLEHVGASDTFILKLFAWRFFKIGVLSGLGGGIAVLVVFMLVGTTASVVDTRLLPVLHLTGFDLALLFIMIAVLSTMCGLIAGLVAWSKLRKRVPS
jgi:cell division transport system permease protein